MNADPSMNELLVYNVREMTLVGRPDNIPAPQIQLKGLSIQKEHCKIEVKDGGCVITPFEEAKVYVNGHSISDPTHLYHGYRILLGNNHWFRVNAPGGHANPPEGESQEDVDITSAKKELAMSDYDDIVTNFKTDKEEAIRKLHDEYEQQLGELRDRLSDQRTYEGNTPEGQSYNPPSELDSQSLIRLQEEVLYATDLVRSANQYSEELKRDVLFSVTLRINPTYLSPRSRFIEREDVTSCVAIRVIFPGKGNDAVWTVDTLQEKLAVIADLYEEMERHKEEKGEEVWNVNMGPDPFCDLESHSLIGVSNAYLQCLFHFFPHEYFAPIVSPQGREIGKISFTLQRLSSLHPDLENVEDFDIPFSTGSSYTGSSISGVQEMLPGSTIYLRIHIKEAQDLPPNIQFVFCQYRMWGFNEAVTVGTAPDFANQSIAEGMIPFNHTKIFGIEVTEEFVDYCREGVLSIEVLGLRAASVNARDLTQSTSVENTKNPETKWIRIRNFVSLTAKILELNVEGDYIPVELKDTHITSGGAYQLKQGQSRKIQVSVQSIQSSGPIELGSIHSVEIGSIHVRSKQDTPMDSFQEVDLNTMKEIWSRTLIQRRDYLDGEMQELMNKRDKNSEDIVKETKLIDEWLALQQERNLLEHSDFGELLGMSKNWKLPVGYEPRAPILYINIINEGDMLHRSGYLQGENDDNMIPLKFKHEPLSKLDAIATWDSSDHEDMHLRSITTPKERVFIILRVTVALKNPPGYKIMLRKRLMLRIVKNKTGFLNNFPFSGEKIKRSGVVYEIFCGLPRTEGVPIRVDLHPSILEPNEGESLVHTFRRGMEEISNQLQLDRLRQEISLKEQLNKAGAGHLNPPNSVSPGLHSGISSSPRSQDDSESPEFESIPGIVVSPPIHRPATQLHAQLLLPHTYDNVDLFTPPETPDKEEQSNFSIQNGNNTNEVTPTPENIEPVPKVLVQNPSVVESPLADDDNPGFEEKLEQKREENLDLTVNVKMYPSDDMQLENLMTPDISPVEEDTYKQIATQVKQVKEVPRNSSKPNFNSLPRNVQRKAVRSSTDSSLVSTPTDSMKRKSFPVRSGTPDLGASKPLGKHRASVPGRNAVEVDFKLNDRVLVEFKAGNKVAKVRHIGQFHHGKENEIWVGLELNEPTGKHNGTVEGRFYFKCKDKHGSFVPMSKVLTVLEKERPSSSASHSRTSTPLANYPSRGGRSRN